MNRSQADRMRKRTVQYKIARFAFYKDLIGTLIGFIIVLAVVLLFRYMLIKEFGSIGAWWNSGKQVQSEVQNDNSRIY